MIEAKQEGLRFSMVAGEVSGDLLASLMMRGLIERFDHASFEGIGGPQMNALGFKSLWSYKKLAVRGYVEVLKHYREIVGIRAQFFKNCMKQPQTCSLALMRQTLTCIWPTS